MLQILRRTFKKKIKLALITCVRNESEKISQFLAYHNALGVSRAYIFLDRCTDSTEEILKKYPWVKIIKHDKTNPFLEKHQQVCADEALAIALEEGYDWLMHIDVDEFAWGNNPKTFFNNSDVSMGSLLALLSRVRPETEMVILPTREMIPTSLPENTPFWKLEYALINDKITREILDPITGLVENRIGYLGHKRGKSIIKVSSHFQSYDAHIWTTQQSTLTPKLIRLKTEYMGWIWHFFITSALGWWQKFKYKNEFPVTRANGTPVRFPSKAWKEAVPLMSLEEAKHYFDTWLVCNQKTIDNLIQDGTAVKVTQISNLLNQLGFNKG